MLGGDGEGTVDGVHFTDLGFLRYAEGMLAVIEEYLEQSGCDGGEEGGELRVKSEKLKVGWRGGS
jgi:hypothetical protein